MLDMILSGLPPMIRVFLVQMLPPDARQAIDRVLADILSDVANDRGDQLLQRIRMFLDNAKVEYSQFRDQ